MTFINPYEKKLMIDSTGIVRRGKLIGNLLKKD